MKYVLTAVLFLTISVMARGEKVSQADRMAAAFPLPDDTPSITGGGLVVEVEPNGVGRKVWLVASQSGSYISQGKSCGGSDAMPLAELFFDRAQPNQPQSMTLLIFDSAALSTGLPNFQPPCSIDLIRVDKGRVEKVAVQVNSYQPQPTSSLRVQVLGESFSPQDGRYRIGITTLPKDAVVILGRGVIGVSAITTLPTVGNTFSFPADTYLPPAGPTTITICSAGRCGTTTFERKVEVNGGPKG